MEEISVSEEQHEFLEQLRQELSEQVVGPYGTVRHRDALQFLIDNLEDGALTAVAEEAASATTTLGADGGGAGAAAEPEQAEEAEDDDSDGESDAEGAADSEASDGTDDDAAAGSAAGDDDRLTAMMNLLDTHDDKWEKGDSPEARYIVELPDGETEQVKTKDDVKALLFKNY